jgi:ATP-binding cassette subfamily C protein
MLKPLRIFFATREANPYLVIAGLLLASLAETVGISTLLPLIAIASGSGETGNSALARYVEHALDWFSLPNTLGTLVIIVAAFMLIKAVLAFSALAYATNAAARVSLSLRSRLIKAIFNARWGFFSDQKSGALSNIMGTDASRAAEAYVVSANVVAAMVEAAAYMIIAFFINWKLAMLGIATGALLAVGLQSFVTLARKASYKHTDRSSELLAYMVDTLANIKPLKSMNRGDPMVASISRIFVKLKNAFMTRELAKAGLAQSGDALIAVIAAVGIYVASTYLAVPFSELLVSALVFNQIVSVIKRLQRTVQLAGLFESSYVRTTELIAEAEAAAEVNTGRTVPDPALTSSFIGVSFSHGAHRVLSDVSFDIRPNAVTVLSGPSGAGKTTLIDLFIGLHRPGSGRIVIGGTDIAEADILAWRRMIGYVPQELSLFHASVRENLTLGDGSIADADLKAALLQAGAADFIAKLPAGLDTVVGEMGSKLSGGQRQRISLARALVHKPRILVLDEVTSALDPETEAGIVENIAGLRGAYTIIAITHRPAWTAIADQLFKVEGGQVVGGAAR